MNFEWTITAGDVLKAIIFASGFLLMYAKMAFMAGDLKRIMSDFPPHRHIEGRILYPDKYEPTELGSLK